MKIFFDVDGVIIEGWHADPLRRVPWDATIEDDLGVDRQVFQQLFFHKSASGDQSPMVECVCGRCDLKTALAQVLPKAGYTGDVERFVSYWFHKDSNLNQPVIDLVLELRKIEDVRLYLATGQEHYRAGYLWRDLGLFSMFHDLFYSAEIGYLKNDIRFFESINATLQIQAGERPLFFDDQPEIIERANQAGWDGRVFTSIEDILMHPRLPRR